VKARLLPSAIAPPKACSESAMRRWLKLSKPCKRKWTRARHNNRFITARAGGMVYRLFTKDLPPMPSPRIAVYYISVLAALAVVLHFMPAGSRP